MAQRLSFDERARIEAMYMAGVGVADTARCLGRDPSTIHREFNRGTSVGVYDAETAQAAADTRARRTKTPKLAADLGLAASVRERLAMRWSPHAVCADLRAMGRRLCAETIYRACYDSADPVMGFADIDSHEQPFWSFSTLRQDGHVRSPSIVVW